MATLKFGHATSNDGFTSLNTAEFNDLPPARIVRELIQNSLDAAVEADESTAQILFRVEDIRRKDIPDIRGYTSAFQKAETHQTKRNDGHLPDPAKEVVDRIKSSLDAIGKGNAKLLSVTDNGIGLDVKRMNSILADGASAKSVSASGSYGVGHLAPMALSDLRYVLYGGLTQDGNRIACGKAILAPHPGKKALNDAKGYLVKGFKSGLDGNLYDFLDIQNIPQLIAKHLDEIGKVHGHGSAVLIPAFNNFRSNELSLWDIISKVAAYNFAPAIHHGYLIIEVQESGDAQKLNMRTLKGVLEQDKEGTRAARSDTFFAGLRPSGQNAYSILTALTDGSHTIQVNGDKAQISLHTPSLSGYPRIDLFRNGMWITDNIPGLWRSDFAIRQPFHAVIQIDASSGGELHRLIRKAEGPMHDRLSLSLLSNAEQTSIKQALAVIADWINIQVPLVDTEEYPVDDFLMVNTGEEGAGGKESFSFWGTPTIVSRRSSAQVSLASQSNNDNEKVDFEDDGNDDEPGAVKPKKKKQRRPTKPLPFRSVVAPAGDKKLAGSVTSSVSLPETWLIIRVDENADFTCDRIWPDEDVIVKSFQITPINSNDPRPQSEIMDRGRFVRILGIAADSRYNVEVEYDAPSELEAVVTLPVLRLELHRPSNPRMIQTANSKEEGADNGANED